MHIHFVCSGNTFRSRLAEAYLKSKKIKGLEVSSSGVFAKENKNGPITWYAARLIKKHNLIPFVAHSWTHTSHRHLVNADKIIFMSDEHHAHSIKELGYKEKDFEIWNIPDLNNFGFTSEIGENHTDDVKRMIATEKIFDMIRKKIDSLVNQMRE